MSALPPIADIATAVVNVRSVPKATLMHRNKAAPSLDHLVGAGDQRARWRARVLKYFQEWMPYGLFVPDGQ